MTPKHSRVFAWTAGHRAPGCECVAPRVDAPTPAPDACRRPGEAVKLSERLGAVVDDALHGSIIAPRFAVEQWANAAQDLEWDAALAWRSFYVACGVVGLVAVYALFAHHADVAACPAPTERASTQLDPTVIRAAREHAVWL